MIINSTDLRIGDEIVVAKFSDVEYFKVVALSKDRERAKLAFKGIPIPLSFSRTTFINSNSTDSTEFDTQRWKDMRGRIVWLVKRENNDDGK